MLSNLLIAGIGALFLCSLFVLIGASLQSQIFGLALLIFWNRLDCRDGK